MYPQGAGSKILISKMSLGNDDGNLLLDMDPLELGYQSDPLEYFSGTPKTSTTIGESQSGNSTNSSYTPKNLILVDPSRVQVPAPIKKKQYQGTTSTISDSNVNEPPSNLTTLGIQSSPAVVFKMEDFRLPKSNPSNDSINFSSSCKSSTKRSSGGNNCFGSPKTRMVRFNSRTSSALVRRSSSTASQLGTKSQLGSRASSIGRSSSSTKCTTARSSRITACTTARSSRASAIEEENEGETAATTKVQSKSKEELEEEEANKKKQEVFYKKQSSIGDLAGKYFSDFRFAALRLTGLSSPSNSESSPSNEKKTSPTNQELPNYSIPYAGTPRNMNNNTNNDTTATTTSPIRPIRKRHHKPRPKLIALDQSPEQINMNSPLVYEYDFHTISTTPKADEGFQKEFFYVLNICFE